MKKSAKRIGADEKARMILDRLGDLKSTYRELAGFFSPEDFTDAQIREIKDKYLDSSKPFFRRLAKTRKWDY